VTNLSVVYQSHKGINSTIDHDNLVTTLLIARQAIAPSIEDLSPFSPPGTSESRKCCSG
jgi:hypothetical protein